MTALEVDTIVQPDGVPTPAGSAPVGDKPRVIPCESYRAAKYLAGSRPWHGAYAYLDTATNTWSVK